MQIVTVQQRVSLLLGKCRLWESCRRAAGELREGHLLSLASTRCVGSAPDLLGEVGYQLGIELCKPCSGPGAHGMLFLYS